MEARLMSLFFRFATPETVFMMIASEVATG
jgi:hypothetical protein